MSKHSKDNPGRRKDDDRKYPPAYVVCPRCKKQITSGPIPEFIHGRVCGK